MKSIFSLLLVLLIYSCNLQSKKSKISTDIFYYTGIKNFRIDTLNLRMLPFHEKRDSLITKGDFELNGRMHQIRMYTKISESTDGNNLLFEIDSLGIFYSRSINWPSYSRLRSNNDSINILIDFALENILIDERMRCYSYLPPIVRL
jgi:hypothetical protein